MFCFPLCSKMTKAVRTTQHTIQGRNDAAKDKITEEEDEAPSKTIYLPMCGRVVWIAEGMCAYKVQKVLIKYLKVLKKALNTCILLYFFLNQDNLYVNSMTSIISWIYEFGTCGLKWLKIVQMYWGKGRCPLWPPTEILIGGVITPTAFSKVGNYATPWGHNWSLVF